MYSKVVVDGHWAGVAHKYTTNSTGSVSTGYYYYHLTTGAATLEHLLVLLPLLLKSYILLVMTYYNDSIHLKVTL